MVTKPDPAKQYARRTADPTGQPSMRDAFRTTGTEPTRHLAARIPETLHKEIRQHLAERDISLQDFLRRAVTHELERDRTE